MFKEQKNKLLLTPCLIKQSGSIRKQSTAERCKKPLVDVVGFLRQACETKDSDLFRPTQTTNRKHRFLPLTREKSKSMEGIAYAWTFRGARPPKIAIYQPITTLKCTLKLQKIARFRHSKSYPPHYQPPTPPNCRTECGTGEAYPPPPYAKNLITPFQSCGICITILTNGGKRTKKPHIFVRCTVYRYQSDEHPMPNASQIGLIVTNSCASFVASMSTLFTLTIVLVVIILLY